MIDKKSLSTAMIYANALYTVAEKNQSLDEILKEAEIILHDILKIKKFVTVLKSSHIGIYEKHQIITNALRSDFSKIIENLFHLVLDANRTYMLREIFYEFIELVDNKNGLSYSQIYTAIEIHADEKEELQKKLESFLQKKLRIEYFVKKTLIGGVFFRCGDIALDFSIKGDLARIQNQLQNLRILETAETPDEKR